MTECANGAREARVELPVRQLASLRAALAALLDSLGRTSEAVQIVLRHLPSVSAQHLVPPAGEAAETLDPPGAPSSAIAAGVPPAGQEHPAWSVAGALTGREREVVALLAQGRTNAQIAAELAVSPRTVERHVQNVYEKLGLSGRAARAAVAARVAREGLAGRQ